MGGSVANDAVKAVDILWCWILRASVVGDDGSWDGVLGSSSIFFGLQKWNGVVAMHGLFLSFALSISPHV